MDVQEATRKAVSDAILALVATTKLKIAQNDVTPDALSVLADFTVCDFGGYVAVSVTAGSQFRDNGSGEWVVVLPVVAQFTADNTITADQTAFAWYLTDSAGAVLLAAGRLETPFTFHADGDGLILPLIEIRVPLSSFSTL